MSKLHKSNRRSMRPKLSMKPMMSMKKPKAADASAAGAAAGAAGKFGKAVGTAGGILGIGGQIMGIAQGLKKKPKVKTKKAPIEPVAGRVQKPRLSKKKNEIKKYNISGFVSKHTGLKPGRYERAVIMNGVRNASPSRRKKIMELLKTKAGTADMFKKPKLSAKKTVARKKKAIARKEQMISNAKQMAKDGLVSKKRVNKDIKRKKKAISRKKAIIEKVSKPKRKGILGKYRKPKLLKTRPGEKGLNIGVGAGLGKLAVLGGTALGIAKMLKK